MALIAKGEPGLRENSLMIDGVTLSVQPTEVNLDFDPATESQRTMDGLLTEWNARPQFDGIANHAPPYLISFPYDTLKGEDRVFAEEVYASGGIHLLTLWRMVPTIYTLPGAQQRIYLPRLRACAANVYAGTMVGANLVNATNFPTEATLNGATLTVTYADGPTLDDPGAGGLVIAKLPETSGEAIGYTPMLLGDVIADGDKLKVWMAITFQVSMRAPRVVIRYGSEMREWSFVEV